MSPDATGTNMFYDSTIMGTSWTGNTVGTATQTMGLIGNSLKSKFGDKNWVFADGYYPRLAWSANHPIAKMYAATRGAFTSVVANQTTSADMFNGQISGAIKIPEELQKNTYSISSSNESILKTTVGGTIIPVGNVGQTATLTITYKEPDASIGGTAKNTYDFTIKAKQTALTSVSISGTAKVGQTLTVTAAGANTYKWYRRKAGSTTREAIAGATGSSYAIKPNDIGYEINVDANGTGTAIMSSNYSAAIVSVAPTTAPTLSEVTDRGLKITGVGFSGAIYEYAYATSANGNKVILESKGANTTISGLSRNTPYWIFFRVAGGEGYEPSGWSPAATTTLLKTDISGIVTLGNQISLEETLTMNAADTNLQTGTWQIQRVNGSGSVLATLSPTTSTTYQATYKLVAADVGNYIKVTYQASGGFKNPTSGAITTTSNQIKNTQQNQPTKPTEVSKTDNSITVKETLSESGTTFDIGYSTSVGGTITQVNSAAVTTNQSVTISGLSRNATYYVYARKRAKTGYEISDWSPATIIVTERTIISGKVDEVGIKKTKQTISYTADVNADIRGEWLLKRKNDSGSVTVNPSDYTISSDTKKLTYELKAEDAKDDLNNNYMEAEFVGIGNYKGSIKNTIDNSDIIDKENQVNTDITKPSLVSKDDYSIDMKMTSGLEVYQYGYRKKSDGEGIPVTAFDATASVGTVVSMSGLLRNTTYQVYVRKASKTGYYPSEWKYMDDVTTEKSVLTGNITLSESPDISPAGTATVNNILTAGYQKGVYSQVGGTNIDETGTWKWYKDGVAIPNETKNTYKVLPANSKSIISVKYSANESEGFKDSSVGGIERVIGNVYKKPYEVPIAPTVNKILESIPATKNSILQIANTDPSITTFGDVYYYVQLLSNDNLPKAIEYSEVTSTIAVDKWFKATPKMEIEVEPNKEYVVYAARLETEIRGLSGIVSQRSVRSVKEDVKDTPIILADNTVLWKAMQQQELRMSFFGTAPTGIWKYYASTTIDDNATWQSIDNELSDKLVEGVSSDNSYIYSKVTIPLKYTDFYIKVEFSGNGDYEGIQSIVTPKIQGQLIKGSAELNVDTSIISVPITAKYIYQKNADGSDQVDDPNGIWSWYRQKRGSSPDEPEGSSEYEQILDELGKPIGSVGLSDVYTTVSSDIGKKIYAVYTASPSGLFSSSAQSEAISNVTRGAQNKPNPLILAQINGNDVQFNLPDNYNVNGTQVPLAIAGYREKGSTGAITWQVGNKQGYDWFHNLKKKTTYELYAMFNGTDEYLPSIASDPIEITTEERLFDANGLTIKYSIKIEGSKQMDVGNELEATYQGEGYNEGYFSIERSDGEIVVDNLVGNIQDNSISAKYKYGIEDIGNHLIIKYHAKVDAEKYDGYITKTTNLPVSKPKATKVAVKPTLIRGMGTNLFAEVNSEYDYFLSESQTPPEADSGDWNRLEITSENRHEFINLSRYTTYYLHARIGETIGNLASESIKSEGLKPLASIEMGKVVSKNKKKIEEIPMDNTLGIDIPDILAKGELTISELSLTRDSEAEVMLYPNMPSSTFSSNGIADKNVSTRGSAWANEHVSSNIQLLDDANNILSETNGDGTTLNYSDSATKIRLLVMRANAMDKGGTYDFEFLLSDSQGHSALLHSEIEFITDMTTILPLKIDLNVNDRYINHSSNNEIMRNENPLPVLFYVNQNAKAGVDMPNLLGKLNIDHGAIKEQDVYLKVSSDGSNYTSSKGVWFSSTAESKLIKLAKLGAYSKLPYRFSGVSSSDVIWPWADDTKVIKEAYEFKFGVGINPDDMDAYTEADVNE